MIDKVKQQFPAVFSKLSPFWLFYYFSLLDFLLNFLYSWCLAKMNIFGVFQPQLFSPVWSMKIV